MSSASTPFPAAISQGNSPNSIFLHLQDITFITRQCFFPVSPTYLRPVSSGIIPAGCYSHGMGSRGHSSQAGLCRVIRIIQIMDGGRRGEPWLLILSQLCLLGGHISEGRGLVISPSPGSSVSIRLMTLKYMNVAICVLKNAGVQSLQN